MPAGPVTAREAELTAGLAGLDRRLHPVGEQCRGLAEHALRGIYEPINRRRSRRRLAVAA